MLELAEARNKSSNRVAFRIKCCTDEGGMDFEGGGGPMRGEDRPPPEGRVRRSQGIRMPEGNESQDWSPTFDWVKAAPRHLPVGGAKAGKQSRAYYHHGNWPSMVLRQVTRGWEGDLNSVRATSRNMSRIESWRTCARQGVSSPTFHF